MKNKLVPILIALVMLAAGIILLVNPADSLTFAVTVLGIALLAYGIFSVLRYLLAKEEKVVTDIIVGAVAVIFGIVVLAAPQAVINIFPIIAGVVVAVWGLKAVLDAVKVKDSLGIILSVITVVLGIVVAVNPFGTALSIARVLGIVLIYVAATHLAEAFRAEKK